MPASLFFIVCLASLFLSFSPFLRPFAFCFLPPPPPRVCCVPVGGWDMEEGGDTPGVFQSGIVSRSCELRDGRDVTKAGGKTWSWGRETRFFSNRYPQGLFPTKQLRVLTIQRAVTHVKNLAISCSVLLAGAGLFPIVAFFRLSAKF